MDSAYSYNLNSPASDRCTAICFMSASINAKKIDSKYFGRAKMSFFFVFLCTRTVLGAEGPCWGNRHLRGMMGDDNGSLVETRRQSLKCSKAVLGSIEEIGKESHLLISIVSSK